MSKKGGMQYIPKISFPGRWLTQEDNHSFRGSPQECWSEPHNRLSRPRVLLVEDKSSKYLALESSGACICESQRATE